ncbi:MAG: SMC family ATPase [Chloroflexaceae bacterium]|nr:SMC family ATPase [Chloroflexaceae bacterium]
MVPYQLTLHNFMCYRGELPPIQFDGLHVACLTGDNGAGKSALLDAVTWALWGKARMSDDELVTQGESEMLVDLVFQLNQQHYRVIRRRQRAGSGKRASGKSSLDLQVQDPQNQGWRAIGGNTIRETERMIEHLLRMSYETFINASFLIQGRADEFTRKTPAERKQVLADILDLSAYARLEERAKQQAKTLRDQLHGIDGIITLLQEEASKLELYEQLMEEARAKVEAQQHALETAEKHRKQADERVRDLEARQLRLKEVRERLEKLRSDQQQQEQEMADLQGAIHQARTLLHRQDEIAAGVAALAQAQEEIARLEQLRPRYEALREEQRQHQDAIREEQRVQQSRLEGLEREMERMNGQVARRPELQVRLLTLEQRLDALSPLVDELHRLREERDRLDERLSRVHALLLQRRDLASAIDQRREALDATRSEQQRTLKRLDRQLKDLGRWQADLVAALQQHQVMQHLAEQLAGLRTREQETAEQVGALRAQCHQFKEHADEIKKRQALVAGVSATSCPLCGSDLGEAGVATIADHYEQEIRRLREEYRAARDRADREEVTLQTLRQELQEVERQHATAQQQAARVDTLQQQLERAEECQTEQEQAQTRFDQVTQQLATDDYEHESRERLLTIEEELAALGAEQGAEQAAREQPGSEKPATRKTGQSRSCFGTDSLEQERRELQHRQEDLEEQMGTQTGLERDAATLRHQLDELEQTEAMIPGLQQELASLQATIQERDFAHERRALLRAVEEHLAALGYTSEAYETARARMQQLAHWVEESYRLDAARSNLERDERALQRTTELYNRCTADIAALTQEETTLVNEVRALPAAYQQARMCAESVAQQHRTLNVARDDYKEKQVLRDKSRDAGGQLEQQQNERRVLAERQGVFQELAEACGKKGVQAMLIETAIPELEREANRLLGRITDHQMHLTFDMQRSTKKGTVSETLDIKISDALGTRDYSSFSGGEAMRINFAIRVALSRLLARRAGASLETLVIDEGFGTLDAEGRERFVEAITSVQQDFRRILVITHLEDLKERFPTQIQIRKTQAGSAWELG